MPQSDILKRYLDAGVAFTQMTRERAEAIVSELVKAGEVRRKEAEKNIEELLERSRRNTEELIGIIRREVADQLRSLGIGGGDKPASPAAEKVPVAKKAAAVKKAAETAAVKKAAIVKAPAIKKTTGVKGTKKAAKKAAAAKKAGA